MRVLKSYFTFGGKSSLDFGLTIEQPEIAKKPARRVTRLTLPGASRERIIDDGGFDNVEIAYQTWCADKRDNDLVLAKLGEIYEWLSGADYQILTDTYDPDYYRLAWCSSPPEPEIIARTHARQNIIFSCDPYRYSWAGAELQHWEQKRVALTNSGAPSLPYIKITANGTVTLMVTTTDDTGAEDVWSAQLTVSDYIELDSQKMDTFKGTTNCNARKVGEGYPTFGTGQVVIDVAVSSGTFTAIDIIPRWRRL